MSIRPRSFLEKIELGLTLGEIRGLLGLVDGGDWTCAEVKAMTPGHLADVRRKLADLQRLAQILGDIASQYAGDAVPKCPIVDALMRSPASRATTSD